MAIKHTKIAIPDVDKVTCVDWNADHVIDGNTGEVLFLTAGGNVDTDQNFFWDDTNKRLGIGTATPQRPLHIIATNPELRISSNSDTGYAMLRFGDSVGSNGYFLQYDRNHATSPDAMYMNLGSVGKGLYIAATKVGIGKWAVTEKLEVDGRIADETGFVQPVGAITMYGAAAAPTGWVLCDGASLLRAGTYADLFAIIGVVYGTADGTHFNVPDMRGIFPRGAGVNGTLSDAPGTGFTGVLGTYQNDKFQGHLHEKGRIISALSITGGGSNYQVQAGVNAFSTNIYTGAPRTGAHGGQRHGNETNPANLGLTYIIKY